MRKTNKDDAPVPSPDVSLLETMSTLLQRETPCHPELSALEAEDESEPVKIRSLLDYSNEVTRGRQKELSALTEMGVATTVTSAAGHRVIQTRQVDGENGESVKSRLVRKDFDHERRTNTRSSSLDSLKSAILASISCKKEIDIMTATTSRLQSMCTLHSGTQTSTETCLPNLLKKRS